MAESQWRVCRSLLYVYQPSSRPGPHSLLYKSLNEIDGFSFLNVMFKVEISIISNIILTHVLIKDIRKMEGM